MNTGILQTEKQHKLEFPLQMLLGIIAILNVHILKVFTKNMTSSLSTLRMHSISQISLFVMPIKKAQVVIQPFGIKLLRMNFMKQTVEVIVATIFQTGNTK